MAAEADNWTEQLKHLVVELQVYLVARCIEIDRERTGIQLGFADCLRRAAQSKQITK